MKLPLFIILFLISGISFGQVNYNYIGFFEQKIALKGIVSKKFVYLFHEYDNRETEYKPNNPVDLGLGLSINNTALSFSYGYGFDFLRDKSKGKTSSFDFQFHNYGRKYTFDIFFQNYKGFYMEEEGADEEFIKCPDLRIRKYGLYGQYVFNGRKFSYKAAFDQNEKQLRSAGSLLFGGGLYYTNIKSDSSFIYNNKNYLKNFQFGISAGYAYTWVIKRDYFVSASTTVGINFGNETISRIGKDKLEVYPTVFPRIAMGYNKEKWSIGFSFLGNMTFPSFSENNSIGLMSGSFQMTYTQRFNSSSPLSR